MTLNDIGIVLLPNNRSKAYLQIMLANNLIPGDVVYMRSENNSAKKNYDPDLPFDPTVSVLDSLEQADISPRIVDATDCNEKVVIDAVAASPCTHLIYCGGGILKDEVLSQGKTFIHVHPGTVPHYRGSTCFYYEMLNEGHFGTTGFFMARGIDTGEVLKQKTYPPTKLKDIDGIFDPWMRSDTLLEILKDYAKNGKFVAQTQSEKGADTYYIIHPVLKSLAIQYCDKLQRR